MKKEKPTVEQPPKKVYVPLWKQYRDSEEYAEYKKNELPSVLAKMQASDGLSAKEREELMASQFNVRWVDANSGKVQQTEHKSEKAAKDKARDLSFSHSPVQVGEISDEGSLTQQWSYEKGRQQTMDAKKQVSIAPISKKEASSIKSNQENTTMATKSKTTKGKNGQAKKASGTGKGPSPQGKGKSQPLPKSSGKETKKTGTIRDQFGLREGTVRAKLVDTLLEAKGKAVPVPAILKAVYGSSSEEGKGPLAMCLKGMQKMIDDNKIKLQIVRAKDDKGATIALKAK